MYRRGGLKRELTAPNGRTAASQLHALWGRVRGVDGAQLLVAGDSDDFAPAAEELALGRANVTFADARVRDILRLLGALEDERRFIKLSGRLTTSDDRRVVGAFQADAALEGEVKRKRDKDREEQKKKRKLLADADSLLSAVRAEAAAESEDEAEAAGAAEPAETEPEPESPAPPPAVLNGGAPPVLAGRGRGVSNLPAWMSAKRGRENDDAEPSTKRPAPDPINAHSDLRAAMLRVARADPDAFDSLVADVWQQVGKN